MEKHELKKIIVEVIPHTGQRYPTVGDYWHGEGGVWQVRVSRMEDWRKTFLVAIHELVEMALCDLRGISEADISAFDRLFEAEREKGLHDKNDEPGFDERAPYRREHAFATKLEQELAREMEVDWQEYDNEVTKL